MRDPGLSGQFAEGADEGTRLRGSGVMLCVARQGWGGPELSMVAAGCPGTHRARRGGPGGWGRNKGIMVAWGPLPTLGGRGRPAAYLGRCGPRCLLLSAPPQSRCPRPSRAPPRPPRPRGPGPGPMQPKVTAKPALGVHRPRGASGARGIGHPHPPAPRGRLHPRGRGWATEPAMCGPAATVDDGRGRPNCKEGGMGTGGGCVVQVRSAGAEEGDGEGVS